MATENTTDASISDDDLERILEIPSATAKAYSRLLHWLAHIVEQRRLNPENVADALRVIADAAPRFFDEEDHDALTRDIIQQMGNILHRDAAQAVAP